MVKAGGIVVNNSFEFIKLDTDANPLPADTSTLVGTEFTVLEKELSSLFQVPTVLYTNSGTSALSISLIASNIDKSTTVFNYCKINSKIIDYVTDTTFNKQGKFTPGSHIKIISPKIGINKTVDFAFLGAWNFKKEIFIKEKNFLKKGGRFITHVPKVTILSK